MARSANTGPQLFYVERDISNFLEDNLLAGGGPRSGPQSTAPTSPREQPAAGSPCYNQKPRPDREDADPLPNRNSLPAAGVRHAERGSPLNKGTTTGYKPCEITPAGGSGGAQRRSRHVIIQPHEIQQLQRDSPPPQRYHAKPRLDGTNPLIGDSDYDKTVHRRVERALSGKPHHMSDHRHEWEIEFNQSGFGLNHDVAYHDTLDFGSSWDRMQHEEEADRKVRSPRRQSRILEHWFPNPSHHVDGTWEYVPKPPDCIELFGKWKISIYSFTHLNTLNDSGIWLKVRDLEDIFREINASGLMKEPHLPRPRSRQHQDMMRYLLGQYVYLLVSPNTKSWRVKSELVRLFRQLDCPPPLIYSELVGSHDSETTCPFLSDRERQRLIKGGLLRVLDVSERNVDKPKSMPYWFITHKRHYVASDHDPWRKTLSGGRDIKAAGEYEHGHVAAQEDHFVGSGTCFKRHVEGEDDEEMHLKRGELEGLEHGHRGHNPNAPKDSLYGSGLQFTTAAKCQSEIVRGLGSHDHPFSCQIGVLKGSRIIDDDEHVSVAFPPVFDSFAKIKPLKSTPRKTTISTTSTNNMEDRWVLILRLG